MTKQEFYNKYYDIGTNLYDIYHDDVKKSLKISKICEEMDINIKYDNIMYLIMNDYFIKINKYDYETFLSDYEQYKKDEVNKINCLPNIDEVKKCIEIYNIFGFDVELSDEIIKNKDRKFKIYHNNEVLKDYSSAINELTLEKTPKIIKEIILDLEIKKTKNN